MKTMKYLFMLAAMFVFAACVEDKVYEGPSTIVSFGPTIAAPTSFDDVIIEAVVEGMQATEEITLTYTVDGVSHEQPMQLLGNIYRGIIPAQEDGVTVKYFITVKNSAGYVTVSPEKEYTVGDLPADYTKLKLNELYGAAASDDGKFIEIYNAGELPIKLKDVMLYKDGSLTWTGIAGEVIPAHGVWAVVGAKGTTERGFNSGFSNKKSVLVELKDPTGVLLDRFQRGEEGTGWGDQALDKVTGSWSRVPDGSGQWKVTDPTCGELNATSGTDDPTVVQ